MPTNLLIVSDLHLSLHTAARRQKFRHAIAQAHGEMGGLDGVVIVGDGTDYGMPWEYALVKLAFRQGLADAGSAHTQTQLIFVLGNHEYRLGFFSCALKRFVRHTKNLRGGSLPANCAALPYFETTLGNIHLFCLAGDVRPAHWDAARFSDVQLTWLEAKLAEAEAAGLPAFIFCHEPLRDTIDGSFSHQDSGSSIENDEALRAVIEKHRIAVVFTGHSHNPVDMAGNGPTFVNVGAIGFDSVYNEDFAQGILVQATESAIALNGYNFLTASAIEEKQLFIKLSR